MHIALATSFALNEIGELESAKSSCRTVACIFFGRVASSDSGILEIGSSNP